MQIARSSSEEEQIPRRFSPRNDNELECVRRGPEGLLCCAELLGKFEVKSPRYRSQFVLRGMKKSAPGLMPYFCEKSPRFTANAKRPRESIYSNGV